MKDKNLEYVYNENSNIEFNRKVLKEDINDFNKKLDKLEKGLNLISESIQDAFLPLLSLYDMYKNINIKYKIMEDKYSKLEKKQLEIDKLQDLLNDKLEYIKNYYNGCYNNVELEKQDHKLLQKLEKEVSNLKIKINRIEENII